ncbi:STAS domain-containing protein [Marinobacter koreensis]|jgi:anti-anti-sigma factor|uniref:Anti-sigma-factor antagonist n=2 Tax=Marinobacter TaxID=2742 RepID=M7CRT5_9GAMM|nr:MULTISPECIES: STAS domain-containing protein [Marinobacter]EMP55874.1 anti-sigma-factor antagonist [Marinobacter santoriniensis NKSG1]MCK7547075.1 STAS domain-containing protein [Marinobacter koreensis]MDX1817522.1 STAS domain-containing protein [Marinobacter sp.]
MSIQTRLADDGETLVISIEGRFDFSTHQAFRDAYEHGESGVHRYVVDLTDTTYLDSSALGMLLLLRDYAGGDSARISIENCNSDVRRILSISNFEQLFAIK